MTAVADPCGEHAATGYVDPADERREMVGLPSQPASAAPAPAPGCALFLVPAAAALALATALFL